MSVFVHAQGIKTVHTGEGGGVKKWQNSVHVVVECPLTSPSWLKRLGTNLVGSIPELLSLFTITA